MEEMCLDELRIDRRRPLISVIGEGVNAEIEADKEVFMHQNLVNAGHQSLSNIAIPGFQVGQGRSLARRIVHYRQETSTLAMRQRAHVFSVVPGENAVYRGHAWGDHVEKEDRFALSPVDSLVTYQEAPWLKPEDNASDRQIYAEQKAELFRRMSEGQARIAIATQSDLHSIEEMIACLNRGFSLVFLEDGHAFGSTMARFLKEHSTGSGEGLSPDQTSDEKMLRYFVSTKDDLLATRVGTDVVEISKEQRVYRESLRKMLHLASIHQDQCIVSTAEELDQVLLKRLERGKKDKE